MPPIPDDADAAPCALCGRPWTTVDGGRRWLHLEITRGDAGVGLDFVDADFCSQEHAAEWLERPLPEPEPTVPAPPGWRDRATDAAFALLLGAVLALAGLGLHTAVRWLLSLL